jgi:fatty-acyl-CoA synthase
VFGDRYEAADTAATIEAERITDVFLVEPQLFDLMDHPVLADTDLSSLRTLTHVGASAPPSLRMRARQRFGPRVVHVYGASEEALVSMLMPEPGDAAGADCRSAGTLLPGVELRFRRPDGALAAPGEAACIEVRSPAMAQGYRNRPDLEAQAFRDGWYRSGDLGRLDADGRLHIFGRAVDIVHVDGRMITLTAIEDTLCRLPTVRYASVVRDADNGRWIAVVLPSHGMRVDASRCMDALAAEHGEAVARSVRLLVRAYVPLTPQGKPDREAIRALGELQLDTTEIAESSTVG